MDYKALAAELLAAIKLGRMATARKLVDNLQTIGDVRTLENMFPERDPLICAIDYRDENIAMHLLEKGFNHMLIYQFPGRSCDHWCYTKHGDDKCPSEYDALDLAEMRSLLKVVKLIKNLRAGLRKPGDGLALAQIPGCRREDSSFCNKSQRSSSSSVHKSTLGTLAKHRLRSMQQDDSLIALGNTVLHLCDSPYQVHVYVGLGYNVNKHNFEGDTPLHLAIRRQLPEVVTALLMNGANPGLRNKLGQKCTSDDPTIASVLQSFRPGLPIAVEKGDLSAIFRLMKLWINPRAIITKDDKTALEVLQKTSKSQSGSAKCYEILQTELLTLDLIHSVLSEDLQSVRRILRTESDWSLNKRLMDKNGPTLISIAVEQQNLEMLQLLMETSQVHLNIRINDAPCHLLTPSTATTIPLLFKSLEKDVPTEIWSYLDRQVDCYQASEKDCNGNTAILRSLVNGKSVDFIEKMLRRHGWHCLTDRNKDGLLIRELSVKLGRYEVKQLVDQYIMNHVCSHHILELPYTFYGQENLSMKTMHGQGLIELVQDKPKNALQLEVLATLINYAKIESTGQELHTTAAKGDINKLKELNKHIYKDKNGLTQLHRAIVFYQYNAAELLIAERPELRCIGDNCNRYPLHYAYALPANISEAFINLLLQKNPEDIEGRVDMFGRAAVIMRNLRDTQEVKEMLQNARTINCYGQTVEPLGPLPETFHSPSEEEEPDQDNSSHNSEL